MIKNLSFTVLRLNSEIVLVGTNDMFLVGSVQPRKEPIYGAPTQVQTTLHENISKMMDIV